MEVDSLSEVNALIEAAEKSVNDLLATDNGWIEFQNRDGIRTLIIQNDSEEGLRNFKIFCNINKPAEQIVDFFWDISNKPLWDRTSAEISTIKSFSDDFRIVYEKIKTPWPVSNRDYVIAQKRIQTEYGFLVVGKSIEGIEPEVDGNIRIDITSNFLKVVRNVDGSCEVCFGECANPRGSLPQLIVRKMIKKQVLKISELRKRIP